MAIWSWLLTLFGVVVFLWVAKDKSGWLVGLVWEVLWAIYGVATQQWGFVASAGIFGIVFLGNYLGIDVPALIWTRLGRAKKER